jgi:hypothetical protein
VRSPRHAHSLVPSGSSTVTRYILGLFNCLPCVWEGSRSAYGFDTGFGGELPASGATAWPSGIDWGHKAGLLGSSSVVLPKTSFRWTIVTFTFNYPPGCASKFEGCNRERVVGQVTPANGCGYHR